MKKIKIITLFVFTAFVLSIQSCKKDYFDVNKTDSPTDLNVTYESILPAALENTGRTVALNWGFIQNWMGYWARSGSFSPNQTEETYGITETFAPSNAIWNGLYDNALDYQKIIEKAKAENANFYVGIAYIMQAHNFGILVDLYNNVPYKNALKGNGNITPSYDKGIDIYKDLLKRLDTAITLIENADMVFPAHKNLSTQDIMFAGNKAKWCRLANTLKLRMLVHCFKVPNAELDKAAEVVKIDANGYGYLLTNESASVNPGYATNKSNPFYNSYFKNVNGVVTDNNKYYRANAWGIGYYDWNVDPRSIYFYSLAGGKLKGVPYGQAASTDFSTDQLSGVGDGEGQGEGIVKTATSSQHILTSVESYFLQAEAMQRGIIGGDPQTTLDTAMRESFRWLGVTKYFFNGNTFNLGTVNNCYNQFMTFNVGSEDVDFNAAAPPADVDSTDPGDQNYCILSQKWFALNAIAPFEIWTDWRRTNIEYGLAPATAYESGPAISLKANGNRIPTRLLYPSTEYNFNGVNVNTQGNITPYNKIFWDK